VVEAIHAMVRDEALARVVAALPQRSTAALQASASAR